MTSSSPSYPSHLRSTQSLTHLIHAANASLTVNSHRDDDALSLSLMDADISRCGSSPLPSFHLVGTKSTPAVQRRVAATRRRREIAVARDASLRTDGRWKSRRRRGPSSASEGERAFVRPPVRPTDALARGIFREAREIRDVVLDGKAPSSPAFHISCTIKLLKCVSINYVD